MESPMRPIIVEQEPVVSYLASMGTRIRKDDVGFLLSLVSSPEERDVINAYLDPQKLLGSSSAIQEEVKQLREQVTNKRDENHAAYIERKLKEERTLRAVKAVTAIVQDSLVRRL
jgi:hypothetical protein